MAQWVEALATKSDDLSLIPVTQEVAPVPSSCPLTLTYTNK